MSSRFPPGEKHPRARLTDDQIKAIRADERTFAQIAKDYQTSVGYVSMIKSFRSRRNCSDRKTDLELFPVVQCRTCGRELNCFFARKSADIIPATQDKIREQCMIPKLCEFKVIPPS